MEEGDLLTSCRARTRSIPKLVWGEGGEALIEFGAKKKEARNTKTSKEREIDRGMGREREGEKGKATKIGPNSGQRPSPPSPLPHFIVFKPRPPSAGGPHTK